MSALPELADRLASGDGAVAWSVRAARDAHGRPRLTLELDGQLQLICQRCLGPLPFAIRHQHALVVVKSEAELPELEDEEDDSDFVVVPGALDMQNAVLEELLLALPMMPRHETEQCHGPKDGPDAEEGGKPSPFAVLRGSPKT
ncbi:MAG: DUF177 domain-containing protein [Pseudomonadota bacterium]|nr:DUF177 domain-containing protein [Pseudomonadota bacterium]